MLSALVTQVRSARGIVAYNAHVAKMITPKAINCAAARVKVEAFMPPNPSIVAELAMDRATKPSKVMAQPNSIPDTVRLENPFITLSPFLSLSMFKIYRTCAPMVADDDVRSC